MSETESPASVLRRAAALMREDADHWPGWVAHVADWLDDEAERAAGMDGYEDSDAYPMWLEGFSRPLAVARAYLGETPEVTR